MTEFTLYRGTPHPLDFAGEHQKVHNMGPLEHPPRAEIRGNDTPVGVVHLEFEGLHQPVPLYELSFGPIDEQSVRAIGSLATNKLVVMSRLAERGAMSAGIGGGFAHPAYMERDHNGEIQQARYAAIPMPQRSGAISELIRPAEVAEQAGRIVNCLPQEMYMQLGDRLAYVPRDSRFPWMDADYRYDEVGQGNQGVTVALSTIQEVRNVPNAVPDDMLLLSHTEAVLEAARTGVDPDIVSHMVFAMGMQRGPQGFQGNVCSGLGYYSRRTLKHYIHEIGV